MANFGNAQDLQSEELVESVTAKDKTMWLA